MTDNGDTWYTVSGEELTIADEESWVLGWWQQARKVGHLLLVVIGWGSLLILLWGVLLDWFPQSSWIAQVIAGVMFTLIGLIGAASK